MAFSKNKKTLNELVVVTSDVAFVYDPKTGMQNKLNPDLEFFGKVDLANYPAAVIKANKTGCKTEFVENFSNLNTSTSQQLVTHFHNKDGTRNKRKVAYLVRTDPKSKTKDKKNIKQNKKQKGKVK